jgi:hypothetical protein
VVGLYSKSFKISIVFLLVTISFMSLNSKADLVGGAVIDAQGSGTPANIDAEGKPRKGLLEDALAEVARKKEAVRSIGTEGSEEP